MDIKLAIRGAVQADLEFKTVAARDAMIKRYCRITTCTVHYTSMTVQEGPNLADRTYPSWIDVQAAPAPAVKEAVAVVEKTKKSRKTRKPKK